jgi:hypothetical protein
MGQLFFFALFIIALIAGGFYYYTPSPQSMAPVKDVMDDGGFNSLETLNNKKIEELNISTSRGLTQISAMVDGLAKEQQELKELIDSEKQVLNNTIQKISDIAKKEKADGRSDEDVLRLKELGDQLQNDQRLLVAHGQALVDLNDQLMKNRQWLAEKNDLVNANNESLLRLQQQNNALLNDQATDIFDKVKQETSDTIQHTQDMIDDERQKNQE